MSLLRVAYGLHHVAVTLLAVARLARAMGLDARARGMDDWDGMHWIDVDFLRNQ